MKIIRSNPWGFGIHSPFVYRLVTKVIFGKPDFQSEKYPFPAGMKTTEKRRIKLIFRLIQFFQPKNIVILNKDNLLRQVVREQYKNGISPGKDNIQETGLCHEFTIGFEPVSANRQIKEGSVWFLPDLKSPGCKDLFLTLQKDPQITVTIEVNHTGLVIANQNYQKQNFYIRRWFCV